MMNVTFGLASFAGLVWSLKLRATDITFDQQNQSERSNFSHVIKSVGKLIVAINKENFVRINFVSILISLVVT